MKRMIKDSSLTLREYLTIGFVALVIFTMSVMSALTLGNWFASWMWPPGH